MCMNEQYVYIVYVYTNDSWVLMSEQYVYIVYVYTNDSWVLMNEQYVYSVYVLQHVYEYTIYTYSSVPMSHLCIVYVYIYT